MEDIDVEREPLVDGPAQRHELGVLSQTPGGQTRAAYEEVQDYPRRRLEKNQQQPAFRSFGGTTERHDDDHGQTHRPFRGKEDVEPECLVGQKRSHVGVEALSVVPTMLAA